MRSEDLTRVQVGLEAAGAKGTVVAANRYLSAIEDLSPALSLNIGSDARPKGSKTAAAVIPGREWVESDFGGTIDYEQLTYLLLSTFGRIAFPAAGADGEATWRFLLDRFAVPDPATYTVESGDGTTNERFAFGLIPDLELEFGRDECRFSGRFLGSKLAPGLVGLTAAPIEPPLVPVLPSQVSVFVDDTAAALGTTRLAGAMSSRLALSDVFSYVWAQNAQNGRDPAAHAPRRPDVEAGLTVQKDAIANGLLSDARNGTKKFIRIEAVGGIIGGAVTRRLRIEGAFFTSDWGDTDEDDGVTVQPITLIPTHDATLGFALAVELVNSRNAVNI